jgi:helix-turn-helix protein
MSEQLLLKPAEAAKTLAICERSLRTLKSSGQIPFVPIGGAIRYDVADLRAFIELKKQSISAGAPA